MSQALVVLVCACRGSDLANPVWRNSEVRHGADITVYSEVINARLPGKAASHNL